MSFGELFKNFFVHKDFLPPASEIPGTMFTPLHFIFASIVLAAIIFAAIKLSKKDERTIRTVFLIIWLTLTICEVIKITWDSVSGSEISLDVRGILPLYPCSIFMYAMPLAIFGHGAVRRMGCGYVCTLGFLGGAINFVYPATILVDYSCISFPGFQTFAYHGALIFCTLVMLMSGYHSFKDAKKPIDLIIPAIPALCVSIVANTVNFTLGSDYMFFKMSSFFFAPIGAALPTPVCVVIVYIIYLIIHSLPYIPFYIKNRRASRAV